MLFRVGTFVGGRIMGAESGTALLGCSLSNMAKTSETFRENAENCLVLAETTTGPAAARYTRMAKAWNSLACEQDWLEGYSTQTERASELAGNVIDELSEHGASGAAIKDRKSQLIDGPTEFRDARVDNDN